MRRPSIPSGRAWVVAALGILVATGGAGCAHRPPPERAGAYPIGLYAVNDTNTLAMVRAAGFNLVLGSAAGGYLDAAYAAGLQVLASPGTMAGQAAFDCRRAGEIIRQVDRHPALAGWYLADEPDLHRIAPAEIERAHRCVRAAGSRHPTAIVLFNGNQAADYAGITDWLLMDRYPIPWMPLADFGKHLRQARFAAGPDQRLFAVVQAFDWSRYPDWLPGRTALRPPTFEEMRAMTFLARVHGATGLLYYCFDDGRWDLRKEPEVWQGLQRIVAEVRRREPLFLGAPQWRAFGVHYPDPDSRLNEALDPAVAAVTLAVRSGNVDLPAGEYLLAVNTTPRAVDWRFSWSPPIAEALPILDSERTVPSEGGWFTDRLEAYAVRIYGPLPGSSRAR